MISNGKNKQEWLGIKNKILAKSALPIGIKDIHTNFWVLKKDYALLH